MALKTVKASTAATTITINSKTYQDTADRVAIQASAQVENEVVFSNEATGGEYSVGTPTRQLLMGGLLRYDDTGGHNGFVDIENYQDKTFTVQYVTACSISGTCSAYRGGPDRSAGQAGRWAAEFQITGALTLLWDSSST
jgi:hypothetical protein